MFPQTSIDRHALRAENASIARDSRSQSAAAIPIHNESFAAASFIKRQERRRKEQVSLIHNHACYRVLQVHL